MIRKSLFFIALFLVHFAVAQYRIDRYDTSYYVSYRNKLNLGTVGVNKNIVWVHFKLSHKEL
ncbi:MAG TPA: hypothetical protein PKY86_08795 [Niabella sp.]|nr:hypothetical protein [Niabella sp.]